MFFSVTKAPFIFLLSTENERGKDDVQSLRLEVTARLHIQINNLNLSEVESEAIT